MRMVTQIKISGSVIEEYLIREIGDKRELVSKQNLDTQNDEIKSALIKLGWTPPESTCSNCRIYSESELCIVKLIDFDVMMIFQDTKSFHCNRWEPKE